MPTVAVIAALLRMIARPALRARGDALVAVGIDFAGVALGVAAPVLLKIAVDGLAAGDAPFGIIVLTVTGFVIAWSGAGATGGVKLVFTTRIIDILARRIALDAARAQLPALARTREGDSAHLAGVIERLPFSLQIVVDGLLWRAAPLIVQTAISLIVVAALAPAFYGAIMAAVLTLYVIATSHGAARFRAAAADANGAATALSQTLGDILRNARRVVFNGNVAGELDHIGKRQAARRAANERVARRIALTAALQFGSIASGLSALLVLGAFDVAAGRLTIGDFVLLQAYAFRLALPLGGFGYLLRQAGVALANIGEALTLAAAGAPAAPGHARAPSGPVSIALHRVGYRYGEDWAVKDATATIPPGAFVVMLGPNGSGKSTLAQILAGLIDPDEGDVTIDGRPLASVDPDDRHRLILYAPQTIGLFNRTLRENALYPPTGASEGELAARLADWGFYDSARPIDLDRVVGEQGARLSGGQVQKLELARLAGVRAPVVILDETTSALDRDSEARAIGALRDHFRSRTSLILITHRTAMARSADLVFFLENGRLTAGRHETLMRLSRAYKAFCSVDE